MLTKAELIRMLQESEVPDDAIVDVSIGPTERWSRSDVNLANEEPYCLTIPSGPNAGSWLTLFLEDE
jgi:hypothetical protein